MTGDQARAILVVRQRTERWLATMSLGTIAACSVYEMPQGTSDRGPVSEAGDLGAAGDAIRSTDFEAGQSPLVIADDAPKGRADMPMDDASNGRGDELADAGNSLELIDDMEDDDEWIATNSDRVGVWVTQNDKSAGATQLPAPGAKFMMTEIPGGRGGSKYAARTTGSGFLGWGARLGMWLDATPGFAKKTYDASRFLGIVFWARADRTVAANVTFPDRDTDVEGGICTDLPAGGGCWDHFAKSIIVTSAWKRYQVDFADLEQAGTGMRYPRFLAEQLFEINFEVKSAVVDIWIDDVSFVARAFH